MRAKTKPKEIFLQPGEYFVGDAGHRIRTVLGSCVSMTLWHPGKRIGAMSHFLLSRRGAGKLSELDARYGEEAMELMLEELARVRVVASECHGKIFGGGNMFPGVSRVDSLNVGQKNGETARRLLQAHDVPIISESLYGIGHRQIIFDVHSGHVWVCQVKLVDSGGFPLKAAP